MHKVDSSGATAQNEFTNGNPALSVPRTRLEAKFMNTVQRELVRVVEQSGRVLSNADDNQVSKSVMLWVTGGAASIRALPIPTGPVVIYEDGSLNRCYRWDSASAAVDNGTSVLRPESNPATGRWLLTQLNEQAIGAYPWSRLSGVPGSFPPSAHSHMAGDLPAGIAYMDSGTFTGTFTGLTTAPTVTMNYRRVGNIVQMWMTGGSEVAGISNSALFTLSGIPVGLRPSSPNYQGGIVPVAQDNGLNVYMVYAQVGVPGLEDQIVFRNYLDGAGAWTGSGIKGISSNGFSLTYGI